MPRYHFPSWDGDSSVPDEDGLDLPGLEQARALAVRGLTELARDALSGSAGERVLTMRVLDGDDRPVLEYRLLFEVVLDEGR